MIDSKYLDILEQNRKLGETISGTEYNISLLANITINPLLELLQYVARINKINAVVKIGNYDNILQDSKQHSISDLVVVFYDIFKIVNELPAFFEDISDETLNDLKNRITSEFDLIFVNLKDCPSVIINTFSSQSFVSGYSNSTKLELFVSELNSYLAEKDIKNVSLVNIDKIFAKISVPKAIDHRLYFSSKALYTLLFYKYYTQAIEPILLRNTGKLKKAIIFDCDNTLWKGILGEDGMDGIDMSPVSTTGHVFNRIQQIACFLSRSGVIVGLCSKNNESDVNEVLTSHPDMVLKDDFIVIKKINWNDKATNLKTIASELNIGADSLIFVDDSDFEVNLIQENVSEITVLKVPVNLFEYQDFILQNVYRYFNLSLSDEDKIKTKLYKQQFQRLESKNSAGSIDEYLRSLDITLRVFENEDSLVPRISQMTQKTNQFNLTTKRYTESQVAGFMQNKDNAVFAISVSDKFGDNGVTGICIINFDKISQCAIIDTFLMSCRIIGRNIEYVFFDFLIKRLAERNIISIRSKYVATKKNEQVKDFYESLGYVVGHEEIGMKEYYMEIKNYKSKNIDYINIDGLTKKQELP